MKQALLLEIGNTDTHLKPLAELLIVAELSRLGRNMFETLGIINQLLEKEF